MIKLTAVQIEQLSHVRNGFADIEDFDGLYDSLFELFMADMPYGTAKARDGDPVEWLSNRIASMSAEEYADFVGEQA